MEETDAILLACDIAWQEKFLELTGYKIGDEVFCLFHPDFGTTNQVLFIILGLWSIGFWICGWVANYKRRKRR